jgi:hypothetical protein
MRGEMQDGPCGNPQFLKTLFAAKDYFEILDWDHYFCSYVQLFCCRWSLWMLTNIDTSTGVKQKTISGFLHIVRRYVSSSHWPFLLLRNFRLSTMWTKRILLYWQTRGCRISTAKLHSTGPFCVAALCVSEAPSNRPAISEIVDALTKISEMKVSQRRRRPRRQLAAPRTQTGTGSDRH